MAGRKIYARFIILSGFLLYGALPLLWAQTGYYMENRIIQRLSWSDDEKARHYEVTIEREVSLEDEEYRMVIQDFTDKPFIQVSLSPGQYRYRVIPYDYLDRPGRESEWISIEVRPLPVPEIEEISPELVYLAEGAVHIINIYGRNLFPDVDIYLRHLGGGPVAPLEMTINVDGNSAALLFEDSQFIPEDYEIVIINPGGIETRKRGIKFAYPEPLESEEPDEAAGLDEASALNNSFLAENARLDAPQLAVNLAAAWTPLFPVYGGGFGGRPAFPGLAIRAAVLSSEWGAADYAGLELTAAWHAFSMEDAKQHAVSLELSLAAQKKIPSRPMALCLRIGMGHTIRFGGGDFALSRDTISANAGVSFRWLAFDPFYFEAGLDYAHLFTDIPSGSFKPWIGFGVQFIKSLKEGRD